MSEQLQIVESPNLIPAPEHENVDPAREATLRKLLDGPYADGPSFGNYEYAHDSGLIDQFYYDKESGADGIVHILSGETKRGKDGSRIPNGFHHEPSAAFGPNGADATFVDREHIQSLRPSKQRSYTERIFEPYSAKTVVDGQRKVSQQIDDKGEVSYHDVNNGMFPKEYDALAVLRTICIARDNYTQSAVSNFDPENTVLTGSAPAIDGETPIDMKIIVKTATREVITAYPLIKGSGIMNLSELAVKQALTQTYSKSHVVS